MSKDKALKAPKQKDKMGDLVKSFKKYYPAFIISLILLVVSIVLLILAPNYIRDLTDLISAGIRAKGDGGNVDMAAIINKGVILVVFYVGAFLTGWISGTMLNVIIQRYARDLREQISQKINRMPLNYFDTHSIGDTLSIVANDVDTLGTSLQNSVTMILQSLLTIIGVVVAMFISCFQMAIVVLISLPLILIVLFIVCKFALPLFSKNQKVLSEVNTTVEENFSGQLVIKAFNAEGLKGKKFDEDNKTLGKVLAKSQLVGGILQPIMLFISFATYAAILVVGGLLVSDGQITFGTVTAFLVYVGLFQEPLSQIGQASNTVQLARATSGRVFTFLSEEELDDDSDKPSVIDVNNIKGAVEFKDVCFGYNPERLSIKNFTTSIKPGMKVAIIGPTGAGKTTLVNLLMRFYELTSGDITVDGVSIKDMSRSELRKIFGMILQETWVLNGTLRENIVYNIENVDEGRLNEILEETNLSHFVSTLPQGIDTEIQKDSALSAGQKQLVTIARAMVENSPMLILDEATSNVDTRTEILIQNAMDSLTKGRTSFVIAHRLSTIKNADLILVMKDGNIVETGTHDTLMALNGLYSEIYNSQFQKA